ncbi:hypothetical protein HanRHA438_Chr03g0148101 [Helianthus annuus]|nr:hypothetical protein HanRHA438_Chr03g0148101 [Helianthus annuus]
MTSRISTMLTMNALWSGVIGIQAPSFLISRPCTSFSSRRKVIPTASECGARPMTCSGWGHGG